MTKAEIEALDQASSCMHELSKTIFPSRLIELANFYGNHDAPENYLKKLISAFPLALEKCLKSFGTYTGLDLAVESAVSNLKKQLDAKECNKAA